MVVVAVVATDAARNVVCSLFLLDFTSCINIITETVCVVTSDGRIILGELVGYDQVQNLVLNDAKERVYTEGSAPETVELGLYVIRGDNVCMIADYDESKWTDDAVASLPPIQQQENI
jgi:U6 snRNA-associated Sm-like protein LSm8